MASPADSFDTTNLATTFEGDANFVANYSTDLT